MEVFTRGRKCPGTHRPSNNKKIAFGAILLLAGVLLLMFNLQIIPYEYKHYFFSWATLLISFGFINVLERNGRTFGIILMAIGSLMYLHHLDIPFHVGEFIAPLILIAIGVLIIVRRFTSPKIINSNNDNCYSKKETISEEFIDETNIFSGSERRFVNVPFKGGSITNVFGGSELDLSLANLNPGKNVLEVNCVFGGVTIIVPHNWKVNIQVNAVLGAFEDKRYISSGESEMLQDRELTIVGNLVLSGGELKSR